MSENEKKIITFYLFETISIFLNNKLILVITSVNLKFFAPYL